MLQLKNYINSALVAPASGSYIDNYELATRNVYGHIRRSNTADVDFAVDAAKKAFPAWSAMRI